ncbi:MAG: hypothetical protein ACRDP8_20270 [Actinopolymorphaceae bacterium]
MTGDTLPAQILADLADLEHTSDSTEQLRLAHRIAAAVDRLEVVDDERPLDGLTVGAVLAMTAYAVSVWAGLVIGLVTTQ